MRGNAATTRALFLDAAIVFSDILTIPDAMGLGLYFVTGEGPKFERPVATDAAIRALTVPDVMDKLGYVFEAIALVKRELRGKVPLIVLPAVRGRLLLIW